MTSTFSARVAADIIAYASNHGAEAATLRDVLGLQSSQLNREDIRIPCGTMAKMWQAAIEQTGDEFLALHMAETRALAANRTTSLIMESSGTVLEAFELAARYSVLIADVLAVEIGETEDTVYVEFTPKPDWAQQKQTVIQDCLNITYLSALQSVQRLTGTLHPPTLLTFAMPKPVNVTELFRLFNCSVQFESSFRQHGISPRMGDDGFVGLVPCNNRVEIAGRHTAPKQEPALAAVIARHRRERYAFWAHAYAAFHSPPSETQCGDVSLRL